MSKTNSLGWSLLVTTIVALGIGSVWYAAVNWVVTVVRNSRRWGYETIALSPEGEPLLQRFGTVGNVNAYRPEELLSLTGQPTNVHPNTVYGADYIEGGDRFIPNPPLRWWQRVVAINDGASPLTYWYLIHDGNIPGRAYGIGFHSKTKTRVGYFARNGFSAELPPRSEWFNVLSHFQSHSTMYTSATEPQHQGVEPFFFLLADDKLWKIDVARRQVKPVLDCQGAYVVGNAPQIPEKSPEPAAPAATADEADGVPQLPEDTDRIAVRQRDGLFIFDKRTNQHLTFSLPPSLREDGISAWVLPNGQLLVLDEENEEKEPARLMWLDPDGSVAKEQVVRLAANNQYESLLPEVWMENIRTPLPLTKVLLFARWSHIEGQRANSFAAGFGIVWKRALLAALVLFAIGGVTAWAAYRRQKRFGLPHAGVWALFAFWFGIPGWVAYRFHRQWPVFEDCPTCRQPTPRDRSQCMDCGASFPPPGLKGIEVFAQ